MATISAARAPAAVDPTLAERQSSCPYGKVVSLYVEQGTEIVPGSTNFVLVGGPGVHYDFGFNPATGYVDEWFGLRSGADGADVNGRASNKYLCHIYAPGGVPGDCFQVSVRQAWPIISGGRDALTTECVELALDQPFPPVPHPAA